MAQRKRVYVGNKPREDCIPHWMLDTYPTDGWYDGTCYECERHCQVKYPAEWETSSFVGETIKREEKPDEQ